MTIQDGKERFKLFAFTDDEVKTSAIFPTEEAAKYEGSRWLRKRSNVDGVAVFTVYYSEFSGLWILMGSGGAILDRKESISDLQPNRVRYVL